MRGRAVHIAIRVVSRSSRAGIDGVHNGALRVRVKAAPVDGAANAAVIGVLAEALNVPRSSIEIVRGATNPSKVVAVHGVSTEQVELLVTGNNIRP